MNFIKKKKNNYTILFLICLHLLILKMSKCYKIYRQNITIYFKFHFFQINNV